MAEAFTSWLRLFVIVVLVIVVVVIVVFRNSFAPEETLKIIQFKEQTGPITLIS